MKNDLTDFLLGFAEGLLKTGLVIGTVVLAAVLAYINLI